jgi:ribokinase
MLQRRVISLGSVNADLVVKTPRLPREGETLEGGELQFFVGGKGANQATASARMMVPTRFFGAVGDDVYSPSLRQSLERIGIDVSGVRLLSGSSGFAVINVLPSGQNAIVLSPGANGKIGAEMVEEWLTDVCQQDVVLLQNEIAEPAVLKALELSAQKGALTIWDPAPARALPLTHVSLVRILTPNQSEAALLLDEKEPLTLADGASAASALRLKGFETVILKMGSQGVLFADGAGIQHVPAPRVEVKDTTAAGDVFNGVLAASLCAGLDKLQSVRRAVSAASLSVTQSGASASAPSLAEVDSMTVAHFGIS